MKTERYLRPGRGEPFGAGSLKARGAGLWFVGLVTAAVWKLFKHTTFKTGTHHLTLPHAAPTCSITLTYTPTTNKEINKLHIVYLCGLTILNTITYQPNCYAKHVSKEASLHVYLLPLLFNPVGGAVSVTTRIDGQRAQ